MRYRNQIIAILALIFLSGFLSVDALGKMQEELLEKQIVVKGDHYYPPFEFINENGEPDGFNVDLFRLMADGLGLNYTIELGPWQQVCMKWKQVRLMCSWG